MVYSNCKLKKSPYNLVYDIMSENAYYVSVCQELGIASLLFYTDGPIYMASGSLQSSYV